MVCLASRKAGMGSRMVWGLHTVQVSLHSHTCIIHNTCIQVHVCTCIYLYSVGNYVHVLHNGNVLVIFIKNSQIFLGGEGVIYI